MDFFGQEQLGFFLIFSSIWERRFLFLSWKVWPICMFHPGPKFAGLKTTEDIRSVPFTVIYFKMVLYLVKLQLAPWVPHSLNPANWNWISSKSFRWLLVKLWLLVLIYGSSHLQYQRGIPKFQRCLGSRLKGFHTGPANAFFWRMDGVLQTQYLKTPALLTSPSERGDNYI